MNNVCGEFGFPKAMLLVCVIVATLAATANPLAGKIVGGVLEKAVAREVAEGAARSALKTGCERAMSSALAGMSARQFLGAGVGAGVAIAVPVGTYAVASGRRELDAARAEVIRQTGEAVVREIPKRPELAHQMLEAVEGGSKSPLDQVGRWFEWTLICLCGVGGLGCLLYLSGFLLRAVSFMRRGMAATNVVRAETPVLQEIDMMQSSN